MSAQSQGLHKSFTILQFLIPVFPAPVGVPAILPAVQFSQFPPLSAPVFPPLPASIASFPAPLSRLKDHCWTVKDHSESRVLTATASGAARTSGGCGGCRPLVPVYQACNCSGGGRRCPNLRVWMIGEGHSLKVM